jgi:choline monooxygenase
MTPYPTIPGSDLAIEPLERASTIPSAWYVEQAYHRLDLDAVIEPSWQYVGHICRLREEGDFLTTVIGNQPVVVVRHRDGTLRGFYNVCKHRGGPLCMEASGRSKVLQCKYHGWTYLLDGSLRGVPRFDRVDLFDRKDFGLTPIEVETSQGLVFARLAATGPALRDTLAGIPERIAPVDLSRMHFVRQDSYDIASNWKVYVDNFLEGYHVPLVHPELNDILDYRSYRTETFDHYSLQHSPFQAEDNRYGSAEGEAFYYFVFPNIMLNIMPGRLQMNLVQPLGPDRCRVVFDYYYSDVSEEYLGVVEKDVAFSDLVQQEDIEICEQVQRGLASRAYDRGRFSVEAEEGVYHFQSLLKGTYAGFMDRLAGADVEQAG